MIVWAHPDIPLRYSRDQAIHDAAFALVLHQLNCQA